MELPMELHEQISAKVRTGRYESVEDVVRVGLRLLEEREREEEEKLEATRRSLAEASSAIAEGKGVPGHLVFAEIQNLSRTYRAVAEA